MAKKLWQNFSAVKKNKTTNKNKIPIIEEEDDDDFKLSNIKNYSFVRKNKSEFKYPMLDNRLPSITKDYDIKRDLKLLNPIYVKRNVISKNKGWKFDNSKDIDHDEVNDAVVYDSKGNAMIFNGYYYQHPRLTRTLNSYYLQNPKAKYNDYDDMVNYAKKYNLNDMVSVCFNNAFNQLPQDIQELLKSKKTNIMNWFKRFVILPYLIKFYINTSAESKNKLLSQILTVEDINNPKTEPIKLSCVGTLSINNYISKYGKVYTNNQMIVDSYEIHKIKTKKDLFKA